MIKLGKRVPAIYSKDSRDFQLITLLFDLAFNNSKTAIDTMTNVADPKHIDYRFIDLACLSLGFNRTSAYQTAELRAILSTFKYLVKNKGTKRAIEDSVKLLLNSQDISDAYYIDWKDKEFSLVLPEGTKDINLLDDIFEYILPAGWLYTISFGKVEKAKTSFDLISGHTLRSKQVKDINTDISNYIGKDDAFDYIGEVPANKEDEMTAPVTNLTTVISSPTQVGKKATTKTKRTKAKETDN